MVETIQLAGTNVPFRADIEILAQCREHMESCPPAAQHFLEIIEKGRARDGRARIGVINRAINLAIRCCARQRRD